MEGFERRLSSHGFSAWAGDEKNRTARFRAWGGARRGYGRAAGAAAIALVLGACVSEGETAEARDILYGEAAALGSGSVRTYVMMNGDVPAEVGVALSSTSLEGLPVDGAAGGVVMPDGHSTFEFVLDMPAGNPTPFQHVVVDWNPGGHEPPGTYDLPHFDFHFYTITPHERHAIDPADPGFLSRANRVPEASHVPGGYVLPDLPPVPFMGAHWIDPTSPELRDPPETFTHTFIYGSWDGRLIFAEPMITKAFLESRPAVRVPVGVAERYDPAGYYPASYEIRWDEGSGEFRVALTDLAWRE
jgi:hypothetical protein